MRVTVIAATLLGVALHVSHAAAQTWSAARERPVLWHISSVDASGEQSWPYGREDVADDGLDTFEADEAGTDLRTVYADADGEELWVRAYVAASTAPPAEVVAFFFLDIDDRDGSGGDAEGMQLWPEWDGDPSAGGFERAVGVRGDGTLIGAYQWSGSAWTELAAQPSEVRVEVQVDRDPIAIGTGEHGYVQVALRHDSFGLDAGCDANVFVRFWHDDAQRSFGDDDDQEAACRPRADAFGDPVVLRPDGCSSDAECPADGDCRDGLCVFGYACSGDVDCRTGERCTSGTCVRITGDACVTDADCDGLVCDARRCVACTASGARACDGDAQCAPNGACLDPSGAAAVTPGQVRGGAFECAASLQNRRAALWPAWLVLCALVLHVVRRRRRRS